MAKTTLSILTEASFAKASKANLSKANFQLAAAELETLAGRLVLARSLTKVAQSTWYLRSTSATHRKSFTLGYVSPWRMYRRRS